MECAICLNDDDDDDDTNANDQWHELRCGHRFHRACLFPWVTKQRTCPTCRYSVQSCNLDWSDPSCCELTKHQADNLETRVHVRSNLGMLRTGYMRICLEEQRLVVLKDATTGLIVAVYSVEFLCTSPNQRCPRKWV